jgi:hypothetical protein
VALSQKSEIERSKKEVNCSECLPLSLRVYGMFTSRARFGEEILLLRICINFLNHFPHMLRKSFVIGILQQKI